MSITIKSKSELAIMREAGKITCGAIWYAGEKLKPGMSTLDVDKLQEKLLQNGILGGLKPEALVNGQWSTADGQIMFAVTEQRSKAEIDKLVELIKEA